jgi:hypothetical protein
MIKVEAKALEELIHLIPKIDKKVERIELHPLTGRRNRLVKVKTKVK